MDNNPDFNLNTLPAFDVCRRVYLCVLIYAVFLHRCHVPDEESSGDEEFVDEEETLAHSTGDLDDEDSDTLSEDDTGGAGGGVSRASRHHLKKGIDRAVKNIEQQGKLGEQEDDQEEEETQTNDGMFLVAGGRGLLGRGSPVAAAEGQSVPRRLVDWHFCSLFLLFFFFFVLLFFFQFFLQFLFFSFPHVIVFFIQ